MKNLVASLTLRFVDRLTRPSRSAASAVGAIERAQKMASRASADWTRGLDQLDDRLNRLAAASLATEGLGRAGQSVVQPLRRGVVAGAQFDRAMTGIGITAGMTDAQLSPLRSTILQTATDLGALPTTVQATFNAVLAEGVYRTETELARAGVAVARFQHLLGTMGESLSDAEAGSFSAAMGSSLKLRADQLDRANAMAIRSAKQGGVSGAVLARALPAQTGGMVGFGFANERGLADLLTANQLAKRLAGSSDQAANNVTNLMAAIASPETLRKFEEAGIDLEARIKAGVEAGVSPLETIATLTRDATAGDQFRIGELLGDRQARDGLMAIVQNLDDFKKMSRELTGDDVLVSYLADLERAAKGPAASFDRYTSGAARAGIAVGTILAPAMGVAADMLSRVANWMSRSSEEGSWLAKAMVWIVAGFAGFALAAAFVGQAIVGILGPFYIMRTLFGTLGGAAIRGGAAQVIGWLGRMRLAAIGFNLAMLANPVVLAVAAAVAAIALVAIVVRKYWQPISAFFTGVGLALGEAFGPSLQAMGRWLAPLKPMWDAIGKGIGDVVGWFGRLMQPVQSTKGQIDGATNAGRRFGQALVTAFNLSPIGLFVMGIRALFNLAGFFAGLKGRFSGWGGEIIRGLVAGLMAQLNAVGGAINQIADRVISGFRTRLGIRSPSRVFAGLGGDTMAGLSQGLRAGGPGAVGQVTAVAGAMVAALAAAQPSAAGAGLSPASVQSQGGTGTPSAARPTVSIGRIEVHVTVQGGADARATGQAVGRAAGDAVRARLFDGAD